MIRKLALLSATAALLGTGVAAAQDWTLEPTYGSVELTNGFTPDPHTVEVYSGGSIDASSLGPDCRGFIANAPDYTLFYTAGTEWPLYISVVSDSDTTLVVNDPATGWHCNDDANDSLNPMVFFDHPMSGTYDIWVGTYGSSDNNPATLYISEVSAGSTDQGPTPPPLDPVTPPPGDPTVPPVGPAPTPTGGELDYSLPSNFGEVSLTNGFTPDPYTVDLTAGGAIDASASNAGSACRGYVTSAPDYELSYTAGDWPLIISALSNSDTTLIINDPLGGFYCDDDSGDGLNPMIRFDNPESGTYDIWVGTYGSDTAPATLRISELD